MSTRPEWLRTLRLAVSAIEEGLAELSFVRRTKGIFIGPLAEDVEGWIGLGSQAGSQPGSVEIDPAVGIRHARLELLRRELLPKYSQVGATVAENIGYLMPRNEYVF